MWVILFLAAHPLYYVMFCHFFHLLQIYIAKKLFAPEKSVGVGENTNLFMGTYDFDSAEEFFIAVVYCFSFPFGSFVLARNP